MGKLARDSSGKASVVVNTCAVTAEAVRQSRQAIRRARRDHPDAAIFVSGCAVQTDPDAFAEMPEITQLIGNGEKLEPEAYHQVRPVADVFEKTALPRGPTPVGDVPVRAHLEVQNGCDHRCTFCIIPFGRGNARSKRPGDVVAEAKELVALGAQEIVLTGVDLTSYGPDLGDDITLSDPIEALLTGLPSHIGIRLSSIDGAEIDERLFQLITEERRIAPYLHLSLQSGDDMILKRMKRRHRRNEAIELCGRLATARPELAFGADLIAGFPTETEEMFENSLTLIDHCGLAYVHVFPFSPREKTPAAQMPQLEKAEIKDRAARLRDAADIALRQHLSSHLGQVRPMLVESNQDQKAVGKLTDFSDIHLNEAVPTGTRLWVRVGGHDGRQLSGVAERSGRERAHG